MTLNRDTMAALHSSMLYTCALCRCYESDADPLDEAAALLEEFKEHSSSRNRFLSVI